MKTFRYAALAASLALIAPTSRAHAQGKLDDPTIVAIFDAANTWDVETASLGEKKGTTKEIRDLGAMFARDHANVRQQGRDLAKKLGVTPSSAASSSTVRLRRRNSSTILPRVESRKRSVGFVRTIPNGNAMLAPLPITQVIT